MTVLLPGGAFGGVPGFALFSDTTDQLTRGTPALIVVKPN
jgi:hypothetical protein